MKEKKNVLGLVYAGCKALISARSSQIYVGKRRVHTTKELFEFITRTVAKPCGNRAKTVREPC